MKFSDRRATVYVQGGLGNQLFCYALARSYSLRYNRKCLLDTYTGYANDQYDRTCRLNEFELYHEFEECLPIPSIKNKISKFLPLKFRSLVKEKYVKNINILETDFRPNNIYFEGYWQSEKYFKSIKETLIKELRPKSNPSLRDVDILKKIKSTNSVFIHIRRVHYSHQLPLSYYEKSILKIKKILKDPVFFIFGDDIEWIKQKSIFKDRCEIVDHNNHQNEINDFMLMKSCNHAIIANSSFSWWAAWLNDDDEQVVICPDHSAFGLEMANDWLKEKVEY